MPAATRADWRSLYTTSEELKDITDNELRIYSLRISNTGFLEFSPRGPELQQPGYAETIAGTPQSDVFGLRRGSSQLITSGAK